MDTNNNFVYSFFLVTAAIRLTASDDLIELAEHRPVLLFLQRCHLLLSFSSSTAAYIWDSLGFFVKSIALQKIPEFFQVSDL